LLKCLKRRGLAITAKQHQRIVSCTDVATLHRWLDHASVVTSIDQLLSSRSNTRSRRSSSPRRTNGHVTKAKPRARSRR
jgi:hypothetical protein